MRDSHRHATRRRWTLIVGVLGAIAILVAACGGSSGGGGGETGAQNQGKPEDEGKPTPGGKVVYGLEAETGGGWCLPSAQLAAGGIQVADAVYDTLTVPADDGDGGVKYVPFLAESVEHNDDYTEWTITIRDGIQFQNGTPFTADVVKQNLDAFRGLGGISAPLFSFVFENVASTEVVDDKTVTVTMVKPWVAFDAFLWSTGRLGMSAPEQLADPDTCNRNLIGTGPFQCNNPGTDSCDWVVDDHFSLVKNPNYWREDEDGVQLPYLDELEFRPLVDVATRVSSLKGDEIDVLHTTDGEQIVNLRGDADSGDVNILESDFAPETSYTMLNTSKPPFDNQNARLAVAHAVDVQDFIDTIEGGIVERSVQPFGPDNIAYNDPDDLGFPETDPEKAKEFAQKYEEETGQPLSFHLLSTTDPGTIRLAQLAQSQANEVGIDVQIDQVEQTEIINTALAGNFEAVLWRNHPGGDPDTQYVWWYSVTNPSPEQEAAGVNPPQDNFVNFSRIHDEDIDRVFTDGRSETDPDARGEIYQELPKIFAEQAYNIWGWYTLWAFVSGTDVHGLFPPTLPDGSDPVIIASVEPVVGIWKES